MLKENIAGVCVFKTWIKPLTEKKIVEVNM